MDFLRESDRLDDIVPGVSSAYKALRDSHHRGIYTSLGNFYNHTTFGRDSSITAKFVSDLDHQVVWDTILTLSSYQGRRDMPKTQEKPGRIHHELRDFTSWHGKWYERIGLRAASFAWGASNRQLLTYFAADTTSTYIRLVHKHATHIDGSILERQVPQYDGSTVSLSQSVQAAANWLVEQVDEHGVFRPRRTNRFSLPYQTYCDSVTAYAWANGDPADSSRDHSFIETQTYALDALSDAIQMVPSSPELHRWRYAADSLHKATWERFWNDEIGTFAPGLFDRGHGMEPLDTEMITAGWALNASIWGDLPEDIRLERLERLIERLFSQQFLTDVGLRTRSLETDEPLGDVIDYHGSQTVWPMFNFMCIEGLRSQGLYRLAREIENRLLNGVNAVGGLREFIIVNQDGSVVRPDKHASESRRGQMIPEENIAFTVVPALTLAYRHLYKRHQPAESGPLYELEERLLKNIAHVELLTPTEAREQLSPRPIKIKRSKAGFASAWHIGPVLLRNPKA